MFPPAVDVAVAAVAEAARRSAGGGAGRIPAGRRRRRRTRRRAASVRSCCPGRTRCASRFPASRSRSPGSVVVEADPLPEVQRADRAARQAILMRIYAWTKTLGEARLAARALVAQRDSIVADFSAGGAADARTRGGFAQRAHRALAADVDRAFNAVNGQRAPIEGWSGLPSVDQRKSLGYAMEDAEKAVAALNKLCRRIFRARISGCEERVGAEGERRCSRPPEHRTCDVRISDMNWMQVEEYLQRDDRAVLRSAAPSSTAICGSPSTAFCRNASPSEAAEPLGVPVFPVVAYGVTPYFREFPGIDLAARRDASQRRARHSRQHGAQRLSPHPDRERPRRQWRGAAVRAGVGRGSRRLSRDLSQLVERAAHVGEGAGDRSCRVARVVDGEFSVDAAARTSRCPPTQRPMVDLARVRLLDPVALRAYLGDGNYGGVYQRSDEDMRALWDVAVEETRALLDGSWGDA